jgi:O-antigen/teichoic acid export membrane protein
MLASPWLFATVYGEVFRESAAVFNVYLLVLSSRIILPQTILYGYQKGSVLMLITGLELIFNVVLSLILVQYWGLTGIAWATVVAFLLGKGLMILYNWKKLTLSPLRYLPIRHFLVFNIGLGLAYFLSIKISLP